MAQHEPLNDTNKLSGPELAFWKAPHKTKEETGAKYDSESRQSMLVRASFIPRPTAKHETIYNAATRLTKMHDGEPEAVNKAIMQMDKKFWETFPHKGEMTLKKKYAAIGRAMKFVAKSGEVGYGKEALRGPKNKSSSGKYSDLRLPTLK